MGPIALGEVGELGEFHKVSSDREYKSIQAVEKSVSLQLKRYGERADDLKSAILDAKARGEVAVGV